jgi:hypothetical protein
MIEQRRFAHLMLAAAIAVEVLGILVSASCLFVIAIVGIQPFHGRSSDASGLALVSGVMTALMFGFPLWHLGRKGRRELRRPSGVPPN